MDMKEKQWQGYCSSIDITAEKYIDLSDGKSSYDMICSSYFENNNIWYTTFWNDLYKLNLKTGVNQRVTDINVSEVWGCWQPVKLDDWLIFLPLYGSSIIAYNIETGEKKELADLGFEYAIRIGCYDGKVYYWSIIKKVIKCYFLDTNTIEEIEIVNQNIDDDIPYGILSAEIIGDSCYFTPYGSNIVYEINLINNRVEKYIIDIDNMYFSSLIHYQNGIFLLNTDADKAIFINKQTPQICLWKYSSSNNKWNYEMRDFAISCKQRVMEEADIIQCKVHYSKSIPFIWKEKVAIINSGNVIICFDVNTGEIEGNRVFEKIPYSNVDRFFEVIGEDICMYPIFDHPYLYLSDGRSFKLDIELDNKAFEIAHKDFLINESKMWSLEKYIFFMQERIPK